MHRSGTSALTGLLETFGAAVPLSPDTPINPDNPKGHWEHLEANRINDEILRQFGLTWALPGAIRFDQISDNHRRRLSRFIRDCIESADQEIIVFKDPRLCLLLPLWLDTITELEIEPCVIFSCRAPDSVAKSISKRNDLDYERGLWLWLNYNLSALSSIGDNLSASFVFPDWMSAAHEVHNNTERQFDFAWPVSWSDCASSANTFLEPDLVHNPENNCRPTFLGQTCDKLYAMLRQSDDVSELILQSPFNEFMKKQQDWLETTAILMQGERELWRKKINSIYYLMNRNS